MTARRKATPTLAQQAPGQQKTVYRTAYQATKFNTVAYHEAGHAVFYLLMDLPFLRIEIFPEHQPTLRAGKVLGVVTSDRGWPMWACLGAAEYNRRQARELIRRDVCMTLAGPLAETLHTRCWQELPMNEWDDEWVAWDLTKELYPQRKAGNDWMNTLRFQTLEMLRLPLVWAAVEAVANAVFRRRTLTSGQVQHLVEQTCQRNGSSLSELQAMARRTRLPAVLSRHS